MAETMIGKKSGLLTVIAQAEKPQTGPQSFRGSWWLCRCECGRERILPRDYIQQGTAKSCRACSRGKALEHRERKTRTKETKDQYLYCEKLAWDETCGKCGKAFGRTSRDWAYSGVKGHGKKVWFCSYHCMRAWQRERR